MEPIDGHMLNTRGVKPDVQDIMAQAALSNATINKLLARNGYNQRVKTVFMPQYQQQPEQDRSR
jgi:hypothetical protein